MNIIKMILILFIKSLDYRAKIGYNSYEENKYIMK